MRKRINKTIAIINNYQEMQNLLIHKGTHHRHHNRESKGTKLDDLLLNDPNREMSSSGNGSEYESSSSEDEELDLVPQDLDMMRTISNQRRHNSMLVTSKQESSKWLNQYSNLHLQQMQENLIESAKRKATETSSFCQSDRVSSFVSPSLEKSLSFNSLVKVNE